MLLCLRGRKKEPCHQTTRTHVHIGDTRNRDQRRGIDSLKLSPAQQLLWSSYGSRHRLEIASHITEWKNHFYSRVMRNRNLYDVQPITIVSFLSMTCCSMPPQLLRKGAK